MRAGHWLRHCLSLVVVPWALAGAQAGSAGREVSIDGDTTGLPASCKAADAVAAINTWFRAVETGDTLRIAAAVSRRLDWIAVSSFTGSEPHFTGRSLSDLSAYVQRRARARERIRLLSIDFTGWRHGALNFGPIHIERSADDLGPRPLRGFGKGAYACGEGLVALGIGPG